MLGRPLFPGKRTWAPVIDPDKIEFRNSRTLAKHARSAVKGLEGADAPVPFCGFRQSATSANTSASMPPATAIGGRDARSLDLIEISGRG